MSHPITASAIPFLVACLPAAFIWACEPFNDVPCATQMSFRILSVIDEEYQLSFSLGGVSSSGSCPGVFPLGEGSVHCTKDRIQLTIPEGRGVGGLLFGVLLHP